MAFANQSYVDSVIKEIRKAAEERRQSAGYNGSMDDGGASRLERDVKFYLAGRSGSLPEEWKEYEKLLDPEYKEYLRLHQKFGR